MKQLMIQIKIDKNRMATATKVEGFSNDMSSQLEILGIIENLSELQKQKIKTLGKFK